MSNKKSLINGTAYSWNDISCNVLGRTVEGIVAVKYGYKQEKTNNYGRGKKAVSRSRGKEECEASITLEQKEVVAIQTALGPAKKLTDIKPFPIVITWIDEHGDNRPVGVTLVNCEFTGMMVDVKSGDGSVEVELPLIISDIRQL